LITSNKRSTAATITGAENLGVTAKFPRTQPEPGARIENPDMWIVDIMTNSTNAAAKRPQSLGSNWFDLKVAL
jgi:hypothetical protein